MPLNYELSLNFPAGAALDGRAAYSYCLWVEPALGRASRLSHRMIALERLAAADSWKVERRNDSLGKSGRIIRGPANANCSLSQLISSALEMIDRAGLSFLIDVGIAGIVKADSQIASSSVALCQVALINSSVDLASQLLRVAAASFWADWELAESLCGNIHTVQEQDRSWALKCFADSILLEFYQRNSSVPGANETARSIEAELVDQAPFAFSRIVRAFGASTLSELWCFMYGGWDRRQFNSNSPTTVWPELRPLNQPEQTQFLGIASLS